MDESKEPKELLDLVGDIYDTVLDRSLWPAVLKKTAHYIQGSAAAIFWNDAASHQGDVYFDDGGIPAHYRDLYFSKYIRFNPTTTPRFFAPDLEPMATADLVPYEEFLRTRFYREWAQPQALVDFVSIALERSPTKAAMFGVFRHERHGMVDEATRRRMRLLAPHLKRAVLISKVFDFKQSEANMLAQAADRVRAAMIFVDAQGHIVHANAAGHAHLADGGIVRVVEGRLAASAREADDSLRDIFTAASSDAALGTRGIALPMSDKGGNRYVAHVLPLTSGSRQNAGRAHAASAVFFIHKATLDISSPPPVAIAKTFKLTMTELRVLFAIVEVGGAPEVADMLGIAPSTVRTHLKHVYEKTGTARQADLVKLVASFVGPLSP
jgi:DNA-binding CsgD family transcriptional regulator